MVDQPVHYACDMCPENAYLEILRQDDGDIILTISSMGLSNMRRSASVEICVPSTGGGKHRELWMALARLYKNEKGEELLPEIEGGN